MSLTNIDVAILAEFNKLLESNKLSPVDLTATMSPDLMTAGRHRPTTMKLESFIGDTDFGLAKKVTTVTELLASKGLEVDDKGPSGAFSDGVYKIHVKGDSEHFLNALQELNTAKDRLSGRPKADSRGMSPQKLG